MIGVLGRPVDGLMLVASLVLAVAMTAIIATALAFEHVGGFIPCALCLLQREPYYVAIPVALVTALAAWQRWPGCVVRGGLLVCGLLMAYGVVLSTYHAGVEWAFWAGPVDCGAAATSGISTDAGSLLDALDTVRPPSCNEAAVRFFGLSFAGWNVLASLVLAAFATGAAIRR